jgi:hypothetical protein
VFRPTDETIQAGIDNIAGLIVTRAAAQLGMSLDATAEAFYQSDAFRQLSDPSTGRYWDSLPELLDLFLAEAGEPAST